jgi:hypothetical protein
MVLPCVDLQDIHDNRNAALTAFIGTDGVTNIEAAYGGAAAYATALPTHNPNTAANITAQIATGIPVGLFYSTDDAICYPTVVSTFGAAIGATLYSMGAAGGHAISTALTLDVSPFVNFILQHM